MPWMKVDDQLWSHPKFAALSDGAQALWLRAGSWSALHLTGGFVAEGVVRVLLHGKPSAVRELVGTIPGYASGMWEAVEGGYRFHDWDHYQPDAETERAKRSEVSRARSEAGKKGAAARWGDGNSDGKSNGKAMASEKQVDSNSIAPNPNPNPNPPAIAGEKPPRKRGGRLDPSWMPSDHLLAQMRDECPGVDLRAEHRVFVDYWIAQPGQKGVKADWDATWRNWMRRKAADVRPGRAAPPSRGQQRDAELMAFATAADPRPEDREAVTK